MLTLRFTSSLAASVGYVVGALYFSVSILTVLQVSLKLELRLVLIAATIIPVLKFAFETKRLEGKARVVANYYYLISAEPSGQFQGPSVSARLRGMCEGGAPRYLHPLFLNSMGELGTKNFVFGLIKNNLGASDKELIKKNGLPRGTFYKHKKILHSRGTI